MRCLALAAALSLTGCAAAPAWLAIAGPALTYVASVNQLGGDYLKFRTETKACQVDPSIQPAPFVTMLIVAKESQ